MAGLVAPGSSEWVFPPLDRAQVWKIRNDSMLIVGLEEVSRQNNRGQELVPAGVVAAGCDGEPVELIWAGAMHRPFCESLATKT